MPPHHVALAAATIIAARKFTDAPQLECCMDCHGVEENAQ
jgi:hypothetical protein